VSTLTPDLECSPVLADAVPHRTQRFRLAVLTFAHFLNDGAVNFLPGVLPAVLVRLALPNADAGLIMSALLVGQGLQPFMGWLSDRYGQGWFFVPGLSLSLLGGALVGLADRFWVLIAILFAIGIGNAAFHPPGLAMARRIAREERASFVMSVFLVGGEIGRGLGPLLASLLILGWGFHGLLILAVPILCFVPLLPRTIRPAAHRVPHPIPATQRSWTRRVRPLWPLLLFAGLRATLVYASVTFIPILWHDRGGSLIVGASLVSVQLIVGVVGNLGGGWLADRLGRRPLLVLMGLLSPLLLGVYLVLPMPWAYLDLGVLGISLFATLPVTILIGQDRSQGEPAFGSGVALGLGNALGAMGLLALGALIPLVGVEGALGGAIAAGLLAVPVAWWGFGDTRRPDRLAPAAG
jgi:FSR family fosmidomycin resistance protein-like MFS transporter